MVKEILLKMNQRNTLISGTALAALAVAIGAFGAHGLKDRLLSTGKTEIFELAVRYQMYHAFAMIFTGILMGTFISNRFRYSAWSFLLGIVFFSGSLYTLSLTGIGTLGAITPIGGVLFILGWVFQLLGILKK